MKLFLISQGENCDYDTYDAAVVAAEDENFARLMIPVYGSEFTTNWSGRNYSWASKPENVLVHYLGETNEFMAPYVVLASYNAG